MHHMHRSGVETLVTEARNREHEGNVLESSGNFVSLSGNP
jgi:hypothetical protein